jgi:hypothetical protein
MCHAHTRNVYLVLVARCKRIRLLERRRHAWQDVRTDHNVQGWNGMDWIYLAQAVVNVVKNLSVP